MELVLLRVLSNSQHTHMAVNAYYCMPYVQTRNLTDVMGIKTNMLYRCAYEYSIVMATAQTYIYKLKMV